MSQQSMQTLLERWMNDPEFRAQIRQDPEGTVRATGLELTEDEWMALRAVPWELSDEELRERVTKAGTLPAMFVVLV